MRYEITSTDGAFDLEKVPAICGAYFLFEDDDLLFIGTSKCVKDQIKIHLQMKDVPFNRCKVLPVDPKKLYRTGAKLIKEYRPPLNVRRYEYGKLERSGQPIDVSDWGDI